MKTLNHKQKRKRYIDWQRKEPKNWFMHILWRLAEPEYP